MNFVVVAYFTVGSLYEVEVKRLIRSLMRFKINYFIKPMPDLGGWYKNTQYKPTFLLEMLDQFPGTSVVYVDVDAEFLKYPELFDNLHARPEVNIGVHLLDHKKRGRKAANSEILSGTIYLKNNQISRNLVYKWEKGCCQGGHLWDQSALAKVLETESFQVLPEEYCTIFDYMQDVQEPVIKHYQASRQIPNKDKKLELPTYEDPVVPDAHMHPVITYVPPKPRAVPRGSTRRYRRKWRSG
jgi:hypothetical protein